ncbi:hypothetical protein [Flavobacterium longum]|uniref:hypothetical protein n=1 Tax=Flavobacterium longum TaxID=1299340 RepID=UPI0039ED0C24
MKHDVIFTVCMLLGAACLSNAFGAVWLSELWAGSSIFFFLNAIKQGSHDARKSRD